MTNTDIYKVLLLGTLVALIDLNDWAVNTVRDYCREMGYNAAELVTEEAARINAEDMNLETYLKARRIGSKMRLRRSVRRAVWVAITTREIIESDSRK